MQSYSHDESNREGDIHNRIKTNGYIFDGRTLKKETISIDV